MGHPLSLLRSRVQSRPSLRMVARMTEAVRLAACLLPLLVNSLACDRAPTAESERITASAGAVTAARVTAPPAPAVPPPEPSAQEAPLPVEEDFTAEAAREIRSDNLEAELDKIERELLSAQH